MPLAFEKEVSVISSTYKIGLSCFFLNSYFTLCKGLLLGHYIQTLGFAFGSKGVMPLTIEHIGKTNFLLLKNPFIQYNLSMTQNASLFFKNSHDTCQVSWEKITIFFLNPCFTTFLKETPLGSTSGMCLFKEHPTFWPLRYKELA